MEARRLEKLGSRLRSRLPVVGGWLRHRAVRALADDGSPEALRELAAAVARGEGAAFAALRARAAAGDREAQEALCRLVVRFDLPKVEAEVARAGYVPRHEVQRALFFFLTGQWERYEGLDFD